MHLTVLRLTGVRISGEDELYPICMAHVRPSFMNSLSLLYQGNPPATILSEQLLSREYLAQYIILWCLHFRRCLVTDSFDFTFSKWYMVQTINYSACPWCFHSFLTQEATTSRYFRRDFTYSNTSTWQGLGDSFWTSSFHTPHFKTCLTSRFFQVVTRPVNYCDIQLLLQCLPSPKCLTGAW